MEIINFKTLKEKPAEFDVVKTIGNFKREGDEERCNVQLTSQMTREHFLGLKENNKLAFTDTGLVVVKEQLSVKKILQDLKTVRSRGTDISLAEFLKASEYKFANGTELDLSSFYKQLNGFNPSVHTLQFLIDTSDYNPAYHELIPEIIRDFIMKDLVQKGIYQNLISGTRSVEQTEFIVPNINYTGEAAKMQPIGEAENVPMGNVSFGRKSVRIARRGVGISITDPVRRYVRVDSLGIYLNDVARRIDNDLTSDAIDILQNGDQPNNTDAIGEMGVQNTTNRIQYVDYLKMQIRAARAGLSLPVILANEDEAFRLLQQDDFKPSGNSAAPRYNINLGNTDREFAASMWISDDIADYKQIRLDPSLAMEYLVSEPMSVESERQGSIETTQYYIRMTSGFNNLQQSAKILLDGTQLFSSTGYPSYWTLNK